MLSARKRKRTHQARTLRGRLPPFRLGRFQGEIEAAFRDALRRMLEDLVARFKDPEAAYGAAVGYGKNWGL